MSEPKLVAALGFKLPREAETNGRADAVLTFVDEHGNRWIAAAFISTLIPTQGAERRERSIHDEAAMDGLRIESFKIVQP